MAETSSQEFHGLVMPDGVEKRILYFSSFRAIATYAMALADLDRELQAILHGRGCLIKEDSRRNLCGKRALATMPCQPCVLQTLTLALAIVSQLMWSPRRIN